MMDDEFLAVLAEFLCTKSMRKKINYNIKNIFKCIRSNFIHLKRAEKYKIVLRIKRYLLKQTVLKRSYNKCTLLHVVARHGRVETAQRLLQCGADTQAVNALGRTPIHGAIKNSVEMVKVLLVDSKVNDWYLFREALLHGTEEMLRLLLNKSLLEIQMDSAPDEISPSSYEFDKFPNIEMLIVAFLQHELHLIYMEESYLLLILFAARIRRKDILHLILDDCRRNLETINIQNSRNFNEMKIRSCGIAKRYQPRAPVELNVQGSNGETALHFAVRHQLVEEARFLLEEGADPNCQDYYRITPLHLASRLQFEEMCQLLLNFRADVNPCRRSNPLNIVCDSLTFNPRIIKLLLKNGANPNSRTRRGVPALFQACECGDLEAVKILVECGANIRAADMNGNSVLHFAALGTSLEIVDFLVEKVRFINLQNYENYTPLMYALKYAERTDLGMIEKLLSCGAKLNVMNDDGGTALLLAVYRGTAEIVECLLRLGADWTILNIDEFCIGMYDLPMGSTQEVLISFIALKKNDFSKQMMFYVGCNFFEKLRAIVHFSRSKLEVTKLRAMTISKNYKTSYFDFLTRDFYSAVQIAKNSDFQTFFDSEKYKNEFPCYASFLEIHFRRTQELENFVDKVFDFILNYTKLPIEIVEMIMINLNFLDFRVFGSVLSNR